MEALVDTLDTVSPRCLRRWRLVGGAEEIAAKLLEKGHEIVADAPADVVLVFGNYTEIPEDTASLILTVEPAASLLDVDAPWRCWLSWSLDADGRLSSSVQAFRLSLLMPPAYCLAEHMRALVLAGKAYDALELYRNMRDDLFREDDERGRVVTGEMLAIFALDKALGAAGRLNRFAQALDAFNRAATWLPRAPLAYEVLGAFWERIGRPDMRVRASNTICRAYGGECLPAPQAPAEAAPAFVGGAAPRRVLMIIHRDSDFGTDTLYDGLCEILGDENVVEFPWKPTLHGKQPEKTMGYPCFFERGGEVLELEAVASQLREGHFDAVVFSDTLGSLSADVVATLAMAGRETPWYLIDMWDQPGNYRDDIGGRVPGISFRAYIKREKIVGCDYGQNAFALPFSYAARYASTPVWEGRLGVFWAGKAACGARRLILEHVAERYTLKLGASYTQEEYRQRLSASLIGLCLFGNGFDTVRYWELPAHGAMLLAERPPIEIPSNFVDGESAVFFGDLGELEEKLAHYLEHPDEALAIAKAGHAHYWKHHTAAARARDLLAIMTSNQ